ncbi:SH3 and multiple ankyrin repeat domains protein 1-like [Portunus trituberculatus]|uniref:SH3 and multiple ankyrin repeat domains protein 1-like n=1 Tax=Portunus trituberculatus TaxID=210409 RepID=UPI001E1CC636|nr:SH3 and multiple ankyrin repeat domains protein 1-like [Portunus trituberculatus]
MEAVDSLAARARGALTTAFSFRKSSRDKGAAAAPVQEQAVTHLRPPRPHSGRRHAPHSDFIPARELTRPRPRQEGGIRGLHEGVQRYQYLPPNPHTVGVPVPELHHPHPHSRHGHHPSHQAPLATRALPTIVLPPANLAAPKEASRLERRRSSLGEPLHERPLPLHLREGRRPSLDPNVLLNTQPYPEDRRGQYVTAGRGCRPAHPKRFTPAAKTGGRRRSASPPPATRRRQETDRRRPKNGQFVSARKNPAPSAAPGKPASGVWTIQIHPPTPDSTPVPSHATTPTPATATCSTTASPGRLHTAVLRLARWRLHMKQTAATHWAAVKKDAPTVEEVMEALGQAQVIALVCGIITAFLMVLALASSDWLLAVGWRQGLFEHCVEQGAPKPLPFQINAEPGCHPARDEPYIMASAALCVICLLLDFFATIMTGLGLSNNDPSVKTRYYRIAVWVMTLALIAILVALILYPVFFAQELELGNRTLWEFGWAYGVGWGAAIFLFGAVVLLLCDQEEEEIYYKERTIIHAENDSRA